MAMGRYDDMLIGLIKELKECHKRIAEHEVHIARERQIIAATIEAHQTLLAKRRAKAASLVLVHHRETVAPCPEINDIVHGVND